jgi:actin-like ATPase involved in cell morphogenesis
MKITIPAGEIVVDISQGDIEGSIKSAVSDMLSYEVSRIVNDIAKDWVREVVEIQKQKIMVQLAPEIEKRLGSLRLSNY